MKPQECCSACKCNHCRLDLIGDWLEGLIDWCVSYVCNVCSNFMPGQSKIQRKASNQSNMANDNNMDIDSDIREEGSLNLIKKYVKIGNSVNAVNSLWKWKRVFMNYSFA